MSLESRIHNIEQCNRCSQCKFVHMPKSREFSSVCPSIDFGKFHAYSGGGKVISAYGYHKNVTEASPRMIESVYACTMCGACDTLCKSHMGDNVEPFDTILEFRAQLADDGLVRADQLRDEVALEWLGGPLDADMEPTILHVKLSSTEDRGLTWARVSCPPPCPA